MAGRSKSAILNHDMNQIAPVEESRKNILQVSKEAQPHRPHSNISLKNLRVYYFVPQQTLYPHEPQTHSVGGDNKCSNFDLS